MCNLIVINKGETELESVKDLEQYFKIPADDFIALMQTTLIKDACLCQIDVDKYLQYIKIPYTREWETAGDYYIQI